jgi:hypothetical protein
MQDGLQLVRSREVASFPADREDSNSILLHFLLFLSPCLWLTIKLGGSCVPHSSGLAIKQNSTPNQLTDINPLDGFLLTEDVKPYTELELAHNHAHFTS